MKKFLTILILIVSLSNTVIGQNKERGFSDILQTYYLHKDKDITEKTIVFLNSPQADFVRLKPILTGFFGALFASDTVVKRNIISEINQLENSDFKKLFSLLDTSNIDTIYFNEKKSPAYNDMNWSSYFASGNLKYLDNIISNIHYSNERIDRNLFLTGASAKWSLCSNARQDLNVKKYLKSQKKNNKSVGEILKKEPYEFKEEMITVIKEQRAKGLWN